MKAGSSMLLRQTFWACISRLCFSPSVTGLSRKQFPYWLFTHLAPTCLLNCSHTIKNNSLFSSVFSSLDLAIYSHCGLKILNRKCLKKTHEFKCTVLSGVRNSSLTSLSATQDVNPLLIQHVHTVCPTLQVAEVVTILRALLMGHICCLSKSFMVAQAYTVYCNGYVGTPFLSSGRHGISLQHD